MKVPIGNLFIFRSLGQRSTRIRTFLAKPCACVCVTDAERAYSHVRKSVSRVSSAVPRRFVPSKGIKNLSLRDTRASSFCATLYYFPTHNGEMSHSLAEKAVSDTATRLLLRHRPSRFSLRLTKLRSRTASNSALIFPQISKKFPHRFNDHRVSRGNQDGPRARARARPLRRWPISRALPRHPLAAVSGEEGKHTPASKASCNYPLINERG